LGAAAQPGFDVVELFEPDLIGCPLPPAEVRARAESLDLRVALYQPFRDFEAVPPPLLARNLRRAESKFDVMEELGVDLMLVCSNVDADPIDDDALAAEHAPARRARGRRHYRCFPGQGDFDLRDFCDHVLAAGYAGPLSLEVSNDVFRGADPRRTAVDAVRSLLVLEDELGLRSLPAAPALVGYAFAELAVTPESAPEVERQLEALGLRLVGPHRTKPVQLWSAGDARVVLNHGDPRNEGIVAFAVESADAARSVQRAEALGASVLARRRQPGDADLAAIAAPDETSVFFADSDHESQHDFVPLEDRVDSGPEATTAPRGRHRTSLRDRRDRAPYSTDARM
jgi:hypothetical protein